MTKKEEIDLQHHKMKTFQLHRWEIIKGIKKRLEQQFADLFKEKQKVRLIITYIKLDKALRELGARF